MPTALNGLEGDDEIGRKQQLLFIGAAVKWL
jgi:hypothetical protein